jgi:hypothetical protein
LDPALPASINFVIPLGEVRLVGTPVFVPTHANGSSIGISRRKPEDAGLNTVPTALAGFQVYLISSECAVYYVRLPLLTG